MKRRRHHNNKGTQRTKVDKRQFEVDQMARKIFGKKMHRVPSKLFTIKEKS